MWCTLDGLKKVRSGIEAVVHCTVKGDVPRDHGIMSIEPIKSIKQVKLQIGAATTLACVKTIFKGTTPILSAWRSPPRGHNPKRRWVRWRTGK
jgi:hypothetical protein